jgi:ABC-type sulfate/molybdate transport systems ATPase subunit
LFFGTIGDNVAYGAPHSGRARIVSAARAARAHEFILKLPEAYDSLVGERGQSLSGGERQRIAIARAILVDPRILILDEATSAVDVQTEREIQAALDNVVQGRTTVAIAHRLSTLRKADLLVVLKDGKVAEIGSASELVALDGEYAKLVRAQSASLSESVAEAEPESAGATQTSHEALPLLDPEQLELELDADGQLWAIARGSAERMAVSARRAFPLTDPSSYVSLVDAQNQERVCFESLSELRESDRATLERALSQADFLPVVARILSVTQEATRSLWRVDTDRGQTEFVVDQEDHVRPLEDGRHLISDAHGMRYLVPLASSLDAHSRKILARFS